MRITTLVALAILTLTGCPDPLEDCAWGTEPGPYQSIREDGGCFSTNIDISRPIDLTDDIDLPLVATGEAGDLVSVVPSRWGGEGYPAILTPATDQRPGFFCNFAPGDESGEACDSIVLRCGTHDDRSIPLALGSVRVSYVVNGEIVGDLYIRPEPAR